MSILRPEPANLETPIEAVTEHKLLFRLLIALQGLASSTEEFDLRITDLPEAVRNFYIDPFTGISNSWEVLLRSRAIIKACPQLVFDLAMSGTESFETEVIMTWSAIIHKLPLFLGYTTATECQVIGATLAQAAFAQDVCKNPDASYSPEMLAEIIARTIRHYNYQCPLVDEETLPKIFITNPQAEIFRLATMTSLAPEKMIERYYLQNRQLGLKIFKPIPIRRFDYVNNYTERDLLTYYLIMLAINADNFHSMEIKQAYRHWSVGKPAAAKKLIELGKLEGLSQEGIDYLAYIIAHFNEMEGLPNPLDLD